MENVNHNQKLREDLIIGREIKVKTISENQKKVCNLNVVQGKQTSNEGFHGRATNIVTLRISKGRDSKRAMYTG
jgi:hypothetical protein